MNWYIRKWRKNAKWLVKIGQAPSYEELARQQLWQLEDTRPNKDKELEEQLNDFQKEIVDYLKKVKDTNEL